MRIVHVSTGPGLPQIWTDPFIASLESRGELTLHHNTGPLSAEAAAELVRPYDVAIVGWDAYGLSPLLASDPGDLRYICSYSGTIRQSVPRELVEAGLLVSNWGDLPAAGIAEAAMTLLLAVTNDLPAAIRAGREGEWGYQTITAGLLENLAIGVYGVGVIGQRFIEMLRPFRPRIRAFDPYVDSLPDGVERADSLDELCQWSEALVIHAGLSDETQGSVTAEHFAALPDGGVVINTARGAIIDQDALFAELEAGRLRAGLEVLEPDALDPDHPLRQRNNVIFTFHQLGGGPWPARPGLDPMQQRVLDQLDRYAADETPLYLFDLDRYDRST